MDSIARRVPGAEPSCSVETVVNVLLRKLGPSHRRFSADLACVRIHALGCSRAFTARLGVTARMYCVAQVVSAGGSIAGEHDGRPELENSLVIALLRSQASWQCRKASTRRGSRLTASR